MKMRVKGEEEEGKEGKKNQPKTTTRKRALVMMILNM
jgi:hypothetical protein